MPGTRPLVIAHRGASREAPENTLAAFRLAWRQGADGIEADFCMTRDGRVVCLHDPSTGRTAGVDLTVAAASFGELRQLDAGSWKGPKWHGERIPSLEEVLNILPAGKIFFMELKSGPEIIEPLHDILAGCRIPSKQLRILTFDNRLIPELKKKLPDIRVCLNVDYRLGLRSFALASSMENLRIVLEQSRADGLSSKAHPMLHEQLVAGLHQSGKEVHVWTVDSVHSARRYMDMGVDSIMTNRPGFLRSRLLPAETGGTDR